MRLSRYFTLDTVWNLEVGNATDLLRTLDFLLLPMYLPFQSPSLILQSFGCKRSQSALRLPMASQIPVMRRIYSIDRTQIVVNHENLLTTTYSLLSCDCGVLLIFIILTFNYSVILSRDQLPVRSNLHVISLCSFRLSVNCNQIGKIWLSLSCTDGNELEFFGRYLWSSSTLEKCSFFVFVVDNNWECWDLLIIDYTWLWPLKYFHTSHIYFHCNSIEELYLLLKKQL